jgi:hypothetical protein
LRQENANILSNNSNNSITTILNELKNQEKTNEAALEILKRRLLESSKMTADSLRRNDSYKNYNSQFVIPPIVSPKIGSNTQNQMNSEDIR